MSVTYFPCFAILEKGRVVFSFSSIRSIQPLFETCVFQYLSSSDANAETSPATGQLVRVTDVKLYHLYGYKVSERYMLFLLVATTVADTAITELLQSLYSIFISNQLKPLTRSRFRDDREDALVSREIKLRLEKAEKDMTF
ncbi:hypothetical protein WA588_005452 [Blastocystis sp. NMH]